MFDTDTKTLPPSVNNSFYGDLGDRWYDDCGHPVALLRAETHTKLEYLHRVLNKMTIPAGSSVLDIGCGAGFISNPLANDGYRVTGIDVAEGALETARKFSNPLKQSQYITADAYQLPFADQSFDVVMMLDFLEHIDDMPRALAEAHRVLKPDGIYIFHTFNRTWLAYLLVIRAVEIFSRGCPEHMHVYHLFRDPKEVVFACKELGMIVQETVGVRPKVETLAFWQSIFTRRLAKGFRFKIIKSTQVGYMGYAVLARDSSLRSE